MTPLNLLKTAVIPALQALESFGIYDSPEARRMLLAIALQESDLQHRRQITGNGTENGPATSFWQFEEQGGCRAVLADTRVAAYMRRVCVEFNIVPTTFGLWTAMQYQDIVAACAARLNLYTHPAALPKTADDGWNQYVAIWRPGKPHRDTWQSCWDRADLTVKGPL